MKISFFSILLLISMYYSLYDSPDFLNQFDNKYEFKNFSNIDKLKKYQVFLRNFISPYTPFNSVLLYHKTGTGKTLTSLNIALNFIAEKQKVFIVIKNHLLKNNFLLQAKSFFGEDIYKKLNLNKIIFLSYYQFVKKKRDYFSNGLIIIDEIHNMINNTLYDKIIQIKKVNTNLKLVLLSATPSFDNVKEIFEIINILNEIDDIGPTGAELLKNKFIKEPSSYKKNPNFFLKNNVYYLTKLGKDYIRQKLIGKVSYLDIDLNNDNYPKEILKGTKFLTDKLVLCPMSDIQNSLYPKSLSNNQDTLFKDPSYISILGIDKFINHFKLIDKQNNMYYPKTKFLTGLDNIKKYSTKLHSLLLNIENLKDKEGTIFIYSNYVTESGVNVLKALLLANGYYFYSHPNKTKQRTFAFFETNFTDAKKNNILKIFNSKENKNGDLIKIFIGSPMTSEGVNFKNIRQLHILDPHWNYSKLDQIIGRSVRFNSHEFIKKENRNVEIYKYASVPSKKSQTFSIDLYKYELCIEKDKALKELEYILKTIAIDCKINKIEHNKKFDNTRKCNYKKCKYECLIPQNLITKHTTSKKVNYDTYNINHHNKEEYNYIKQEIVSLFSTYKILHLHDIEFFLNKIEHKKNIYVVLNDLIKDKKIKYFKEYYIML